MRFIEIGSDRIEVKVGAIVREPPSHILARAITAGARCESVDPELWRAILFVDDAVAWQGDSHKTYTAAWTQVRKHREESVTRFVTGLFS